MRSLIRNDSPFLRAPRASVFQVQPRGMLILRIINIIVIIGTLVGIFLVDVFGNELLLHAEGKSPLGCYNAMPLKRKDRPSLKYPVTGSSTSRHSMRTR